MEFERGKSYEELEIGEKASFAKTITETDVYLFAGISGDFNPMHVNEEYARTTPFGACVAHGPLILSFHRGEMVAEGSALVSPPRQPSG